jgi:hypothetical protein
MRAVAPREEKAVIRQGSLRVFRSFPVSVIVAISIIIHISQTRYKLCKSAIRHPRCVFNNEYRCGKDV